MPSCRKVMKMIKQKPKKSDGILIAHKGKLNSRAAYSITAFTNDREKAKSFEKKYADKGWRFHAVDSVKDPRGKYRIMVTK